MANIALRPYQEDILHRLREAIIAGHRTILLYAPTGAGKTEMAISLLEAANKKGNRSAMILDRIVLCDQTSARLQKYNIDHGVMQSGHWRWRPHERIQVCSAQTLEKRGAVPGTNLLVVDECHAVRKLTIEYIKKRGDAHDADPNANSKLITVGLSASPFTDGLKNIYSTVVSAVTTAQLVEWGNLAPLRVFICKEADMSGAKKVAGEWSVDDAGSAGIKIAGDVVSTWVQKTHEIFGGPRKTIVFCANVAHGAELAQKFAAAGYNFVPISYMDSDEFKQEAVKDFSRPDTNIHGLIACDILTKGFDVPDVMIGVSARPFSKSFNSHVQQMGRVMRAFDGKDFGLWLCHSGNYLRFQDDWDELYEEGVKELRDGKEKAKAEKSHDEKEAAKCPKCSALWSGRSRVCSHCGFERPLRSTVETVDGVVEELTPGSSGKEKFTKAQKQSWYGQLMTIAESKGYSPGWVAHKYKEKFGVWPRGLEDRPEPVTPELASWEKSRRIAWAKAKGRAAA